MKKGDCRMNTSSEWYGIPPAIIKNRVRCDSCGDIVESTGRNDMRWCSCNSVAVDGGTTYLRRIGGSYREMSVTAPEELRVHRLEHSTIALRNVHHSKSCEGLPCPVHNRTDHPLRDEPQKWIGQMYRTCKHNLYHVDPDEQPILTKKGKMKKRQCLKTCDGCCGRPA